ncbi:hypothetical protein ABZ990_24315 [Streptomyces sp. NPDC046203]|uniref:hypothetical protein n=1 Tax=Streptomyces sp. NPDC046203 TaxID=3154602 RepID=UPI0033EF1E21
MAVIVTLEFPGVDEEGYRHTFDKITGAPWFPTPGFLAHAAGPDGAGGWRVIDFWDSEEAYRMFARKTLPILQETGLTSVTTRIDKAVEVVVPPPG